MLGKDAPRERHPARGHEADAEAPRALVTLLEQVTEVILAEGVRPRYTRTSRLDRDRGGGSRRPRRAAIVLGLLPDTGHLAWAGVDVRALIADYADRVPFVHVKDAG